MSQTVAQHLAASLRTAARAFTPGDQVAPCAVLWADPENLWSAVIPQLQADIPELYQLGAYAPDRRTGPALWLRCIEGRTVEGAPSPGVTPIFHLSGIGRDTLRAVEDYSIEVAALVELQFRGNLWLHVNGKEWTPTAFLSSKHGGLELDLATDQATREAVLRSLPKLLEEPVERLRNRRLDADHLNGLLAPDQTGLLLRWLSGTEDFQRRLSPAEWEAFCHQTRSDYGFDVLKDGHIKAARLLAGRSGIWEQVWTRFAESPATFRGVVEWLRRAAPRERSLFDHPDSALVWPDQNDCEERSAAAALEALGESSQSEAIQRVQQLESVHAPRRGYPWTKLGMSRHAVLLEPLNRLAAACANPLGGASADDFAAAYAATGWDVDAAAIAALDASHGLDDPTPVLKVIRNLYLPWIETTARHLQTQIQGGNGRTARRHGPPGRCDGLVIVFADGLRMDIGGLLKADLESEGNAVEFDWDWAPLPSVTATAKPAVSPIAADVTGNGTGEGFEVRLKASGQPLTSERFRTALAGSGWQVLESTDTGDPSGAAWTEAGEIDKRGHHEGWKLAQSLAGERRDLARRIGRLLAAGWKEVLVVTDHGWLLMPLGLPKVDLKSFLTAERWGRCASIKPGSQSDQTTYPWHWNPAVEIACPPGAGCYRAGMEYSHGGVSLQELVIPRLRVRSGSSSRGGARITSATWTGARCRVEVTGLIPGLQVDLRTTLGDPASSLLADGQPRELTPEGKATLFLESDADIGRSAEIVLLSGTSEVVHSLPTTIGN